MDKSDAQMAFFSNYTAWVDFYPTLTNRNFWIVTKCWTSLSIAHNDF